MEKAVLVIAEEVVAAESKKHIDQQNQSHSLLESSSYEVVDCLDDGKQLGGEHGSVLQEGYGSDDYNGRVYQHAHLVEVEQVLYFEVTVVCCHVYQVRVSVGVVYVF